MNNYKTSQRKTIMEYLIDNKDKFVNAEEVLEHLKKNKQEVGLTTIYRFLNLLEKNDDVRVETREHTKYYQYVPKEVEINETGFIDENFSEVTDELYNESVDIIDNMECD